MNRPWLDGLLEQMQAQLGSLGDAQRERLLAGFQSPWWLSALLGLAAWIASIFFIASFLGPWLVFIEGPLGRCVAGILLILTALWMFRRRQLFGNQVGLALSLAGQGILIFVLAEQLKEQPDALRPLAAFSLLIAGILLWLPTSFLHRHVCALVVLACLAVLIGAGTGLAVYCIALAATACALWLQRKHWVTHPQAPRIRALTDAATLLSLILAVHVHADMFGQPLDLDLPAAGQWAHFVYPVGIGAVLLGVVAWLVRSVSGPRYWQVLGGTLLLAVLASNAPGFLLSLGLGLAVFQASNRSWLIVMPAFATFYLFILYYSLHISLLEKSLLMVASGAAMLVMARCVARRWRASQ